MDGTSVWSADREMIGRVAVAPERYATHRISIVSIHNNLKSTGISGEYLPRVTQRARWVEEGIATCPNAVGSVREQMGRVAYEMSCTAGQKRHEETIAGTSTCRARAKAS